MSEPVVGVELAAVRGFDYGPQRYEAGDRFPWRDVGCSYFKAWELWKTGCLEVVGIELRAAKSFEHVKGGAYKRGDRFSWKELGVTERDASDLIGAGFVEVASVAPYKQSPKQFKQRNEKRDRP